MRKNVIDLLRSWWWGMGFLLSLGAHFTAAAQYFTQIATLDDHLPSNKVNCLVTDREQNVWVGTDRGLAKFSAKDSTWQTVVLPEIGQVTALAVDGQGQIWVSGLQQSVKLVQLDLSGKVLFQSEVPNFQNKSLYVNGLAVDKQRRKWLATDEGGVWMIDQNNKWFCYDQSTQPDMPTNKMNSVVIDETDTKWFGTEMGLLSTEDGQDWPLYYVEGAVNASAADGAGTVCVGVINRKGRSEMYCNKDVYKLVGQRQKDNAFKIRAILMEEQGGVVWAVGTGIARYAKSSKELFDLDNSGLTSNLATCIGKSVSRSGEKVFWVGTADKGVFLLRFSTPPVIPVEEPVVAKVDTKALDASKPVNLSAGVSERQPELKKVEIVALPEAKPEPEPEPLPQLEVKPEPKPAEVAVTLNEQKIKAGETISLEKLSFVKGSARLTDYIGADVLVKFMQAHPNVEIELSGHTDKNPDTWHPEYARISSQHLELSKQRVETVANYLIKKGIAPERIKTQAYGGEKPLVNKSSEKNMRVDLKLLKVN